MLIDKINSFCRDIEFLPMSQRLAFQSYHDGVLTDQADFIITSGKVLYSPRLKSFGAFLTGYLNGTVTMSHAPCPEPAKDGAILIDLRLMVWLTIKESAIGSSEHAAELSGRLFAKCNAATADRFKFLTGERIESLVLIYFQSYPKPLDKFLEDYPSVERSEFHRSIIAMAMIGVAELMRVPVAAERKAPAMDAPKAREISETITPEVLERVRGLMKIMQTIKLEQK